MELCRRRLPNDMGIPADQIQVLSPTRKPGAGTAVAQPGPPGRPESPRRAARGSAASATYIFRAGDRVMQVRNNYDILWREEDGPASGMGMFNGDIGVILAVDNGRVVTVDFDGRWWSTPRTCWGSWSPPTPSPSTRPRAASTGR